MKRIYTLISLIILFTTTAFAQTDKWTLEDLFGYGKFYPQYIRGFRSMNDGEHYTVLENDGSSIVKYSYKTGKNAGTVLDISKAGGSKIRRFQSYSFNADETKILLTTEVRPIYRRSFTARYYIYDIKNNEIKPLSEGGPQQVATFSPDGRRIAFVRNNNIFIHDMRYGSELQITSDGERNKIINGIPDWVYEEEFSFNRAFEWAPDGSALAYIKFDESEVKEYEMQIFEGQHPAVRKNALYPSVYRYKYPKAGEKNSEISVCVYDIKDKITMNMDLGTNKDIYVPRIQWTGNPKKLAIMRLNRHQNHLEILVANAKTGKTVSIYEEKNKCYIAESNFDNLQFLEGNKGFVFTSEKNGYMHIYRFDMNGKQVKEITPGAYDIKEFYGYDSASKRYFYSSYEISPVEKHIYSIDEKGNKRKLSSLPGWHSADFSRNFKYWVHRYSNINTPPVTEICNGKGKTIRLLTDNSELKETARKYGITTKEFIEIPAADGKTILNAWILKPANFDASKRYPVVINQYSGPESQQVKNEWGIDFWNYLAQEGYIVVTVDPRGTGGRGEAFRKCTYLRLGDIESSDLIASGKWLSEQHYADPAKIGIWGWSYGGFMASLCILKGNDVFSTAIAIAPVTNFKYYDTVYTERFMRTPGENPEGYEKYSPLNWASHLKGNLLLCHGTADDNVHIQNTYELSERLVQAGKQFDMAVYLNRNHSIYGGMTTLQLYHKFVKYLNEHLK